MLYRLKPLQWQTKEETLTLLLNNTFCLSDNRIRCLSMQNVSMSQWPRCDSSSHLTASDLHFGFVSGSTVCLDARCVLLNEWACCCTRPHPTAVV